MPPSSPHNREKSWERNAAGHTVATAPLTAENLVCSSSRSSLPSISTIGIRCSAATEASGSPRLLRSTPCPANNKISRGDEGACSCLVIRVTKSVDSTLHTRTRKRYSGCSAHCGGSPEDFVGDAEQQQRPGESYELDENDDNSSSNNGGGDVLVNFPLNEFLRATEGFAAGPEVTVGDVFTPVTASSRLCPDFPEGRPNLGALEESSQEPVIAAYIAGLDRCDRRRLCVERTFHDSSQGRRPTPTSTTTVTDHNPNKWTAGDHQATRPATSSAASRGCSPFTPRAPSSQPYQRSSPCGPHPNVHRQTIHSSSLSFADMRRPHPREGAADFSQFGPASPRSDSSPPKQRKHLVKMMTPAGYGTPPSVYITRARIATSRAKASTRSTKEFLKGARRSPDERSTALEPAENKTNTAQGGGARGSCVWKIDREGQQRARRDTDLFWFPNEDTTIAGVTGDARFMKNVGFQEEANVLLVSKAAMVLTRNHRRVSAGVASSPV